MFFVSTRLMLYIVFISKLPLQTEPLFIWLDLKTPGTLNLPTGDFCFLRFFTVSSPPIEYRRFFIYTVILCIKKYIPKMHCDINFGVHCCSPSGTKLCGISFSWHTTLLAEGIDVFLDEFLFVSDLPTRFSFIGAKKKIKI